MEKEISLYVVATPIGNLSDLSPRAQHILAQVDFIAAEDTRNTGVLLKHFGIKKPMISYFEHNIAQRGQEIVRRLLTGQTCALVSDAGMPAISDPGEVLVGQCLEQGLRVSAVPGPCAAVTALAMSGISARRFCFEGFLSTAKNSRRAHLQSLKDEKRTMIFYEAPHKLCGTLKDMYAVFGSRRVSFVREITKIYEQTLIMTLDRAIEYYEAVPPRGEFVLVVEGAPEQPPEFNDENVRAVLETFLANGMKKSEAARAAAEKLGLPRREIYELFRRSQDADDSKL